MPSLFYNHSVESLSRTPYTVAATVKYGASFDTGTETRLIFELYHRTLQTNDEILRFAQNDFFHMYHLSS